MSPRLVRCQAVSVLTGSGFLLGPTRLPFSHATFLCSDWEHIQKQTKHRVHGRIPQPGPRLVMLMQPEAHQPSGVSALPHACPGVVPLPKTDRKTNNPRNPPTLNSVPVSGGKGRATRL